MANGSLLDQPRHRNLVDSLAGNPDNRQAMQRPHGGAAATVTYGLLCRCSGCLTSGFGATCRALP
jgi:hypothetical protein